MSNFLSKASNLLNKGIPLVLATIISSDGSTPRTAGSKMIVLADGRIIDTIGGGQVEDKVIKEAVNVFISKQSIITHYNLTGKDADSMDMICGGSLSVSIEWIDADEENKRLFQKAASLLENRTDFQMITGFPSGGDAASARIDRAILTAKGIAAGTLSVSTPLQSYLDRTAPKTAVMLNFEDKDYFIEPFVTRETVYIFGGGHISRQLAKLTDIIEMDTVVLDDREEFANSKRFPTASTIVLDNFETALESLQINKNSYLIIVTRGHVHDRTVLREALKTDAGYIGMIGSVRKRDAIYKALILEGFNIDDLKRVYSPIGLDIGSETPQEIAVSIISEMISVKRG